MRRARSLWPAFGRPPLPRHYFCPGILREAGGERKKTVHLSPINRVALFEIWRDAYAKYRSNYAHFTPADGRGLYGLARPRRARVYSDFLLAMTVLF